MPRINQAYPPEFRREAIRLELELPRRGASYPQGTAREIGVSDGTLRSSGSTRTRSTAASEKGSPQRRRKSSAGSDVR